MKEYSQEEIDAAVEAQVQQFKKADKKPSILLLGQTGTGKTSAALNYIFDSEKFESKVGNGAVRGNVGIDFYEGPNINIFDSEGYEIARQEHYRKLIIDGFLKDPSKQGPDGIQAVWFFVSGAAKRITDYDVSLIKEIQEMGYKVALIISKIDEMSQEQLAELKRVAQAELKDINIFQISTAEELRNNPEITDWDKLTEWTWSVLGEYFQSKFVWALKGSLELKKKQITKWILAATTAAAGVGAAPIPFADAPALAALQGTLVWKILRTYNVQVSNSTVTGLLSSIGVSQVGRWLCGQILKFVPVLGSIANASVAAALTFALGKAVDIICQKQAAQMLNGQPVKIDVDQMLGSSEFKDLVMTQFSEVKDNIMTLIQKKD